MREIVHIQLGQAGNNVGNKVSNQTQTKDNGVIHYFYKISFGKLSATNTGSIPKDTITETQIFSWSELMYTITRREVVNMFPAPFLLIWNQVP